MRNIRVNGMKHPMNLLHYLQFQFKTFLIVSHSRKIYILEKYLFSQLLRYTKLLSQFSDAKTEAYNN